MALLPLPLPVVAPPAAPGVAAGEEAVAEPLDEPPDDAQADWHAVPGANDAFPLLRLGSDGGSATKWIALAYYSVRELSGPPPLQL